MISAHLVLKTLDQSWCSPWQTVKALHVKFTCRFKFPLFFASYLSLWLDYTAETGLQMMYRANTMFLCPIASTMTRNKIEFRQCELFSELYQAVQRGHVTFDLSPSDPPGDEASFDEEFIHICCFWSTCVNGPHWHWSKEKLTFQPLNFVVTLVHASTVWSCKSEYIYFYWNIQIEWVATEKW